MPYYLREGQVHRLILPFFLHYSFSHLLIALFLQMLIGFNFEKIVGTFKLFLFWCATVIGGNVFGALCTSDYALGSDLYVFALLGGLMGVVMVFLCRKD